MCGNMQIKGGLTNEHIWSVSIYANRNWNNNWCRFCCCVGRYRLVNIPLLGGKKWEELNILS